MISRCLTFVALTAALSVSAAASQAPAPAPSTTPANRGRTSVQAPRAATPVPTPAPGTTPVEVAPTPRIEPVAPMTPVPRRENQSTNIRIEVTVTDQRPGAPAVTKTVGVVTGDGLNGSVRSQTNYLPTGAGPGSAPFNVDAWPTILADGKVHVRLTVQYDVVPPPLPAQGEPPPLRLMGTTIRDSVALILENGKPIVAVQSSDPVSDRKVSIEVKATVLK